MKKKTTSIINAENLSKAYRIIQSPWKRFCYHVFKVPSGRDFYALNNISFQINQGETFGIIGKNGSGKSTLLQILAGIIKPTEGILNISGRIAALLELGSGFNPESTGYENIFTNAAILGVKKEEIRKKVQDIIDFADIGDFIYQPVKTYSSGMYIRLAFAVAINVDADIILIDEALAVGDVFFRQKCYSRLNQLKQEGKTIILVTHSMNEIEQFCDRALLLSKGDVVILGPSQDVVEEYYLMDQKEKEKSIQVEQVIHYDYSPWIKKTDFFGDWAIKKNLFLDLNKSIEHGNGKGHYVKVGVFDQNGYPKEYFTQGETAFIYTEIMIDSDIAKPINGIAIFDEKSNIIYGKNTLQTYKDIPDVVRKGTVVCSCFKVKLSVAIGEYTFEVGFTTVSKEIYENRSSFTQEELDEHVEIIADRRNVGLISVHGITKGEPTKLPFYGLCNLQDDFDMTICE